MKKVRRQSWNRKKILANHLFDKEGPGIPNIYIYKSLTTQQ